MSVVVGIDLGGSGSRLAISGVEPGAPERHFSFGPSRIGSGPISEGVIGALRQLRADEGIVALCIGTTGMPGLLRDSQRLAALLFKQLTLDTVIVAGDCVTTHVGALGGEPGVVVAAGTGTIVLGTDFRHVWQRVDGWGHLIGDEGSGAWIGRRGLSSALAAYDGRGGSPRLLELMQARYGEIPQLLHALYRQGQPARELARFAPDVEDAARAGDPVALQIWRDAGAAMAASVAAAAKGLPPNVSWGGGLFRAGELVMEPFVAHLGRVLPDARIAEPRGDSLAGALKLARDLAEGSRLPCNEFHQIHER